MPALGSAPAATGGPRFRRSAGEHFLFALRPFPASRPRRPADRRANPHRSQAPQLPIRAPSAPTARPAAVEQVPGDRGRVRAEGHGRHLDRQERSAQRAGNPVRDRSRPALHQCQRDRGRQRDDAAGGQDGRRAHRAHPAGQAHEPGSGHHRRNLDGLERDHPELASAVDFIAAHILPYWEGDPGEQAVDGPSPTTTSCAAPTRASAS